MRRVFVANLLIILCVLAQFGCGRAPSTEDVSTSADKKKDEAAAQGEQAVQAAPASTEAPRYSGPIKLTDATAEAGINFKHNSGASGKKYLPETLGAGCAFLDYDN